MGWPVGPEYAASSNVEHAHQLTGRLMLLVGELDTNVDPSSTFQVANALIRAKKDFELVVIPGAGHGSGGAFGARKRNDFFVRHLLGIDPPAWNTLPDTAQASGDPGAVAWEDATWTETELPAPRDLERATRRQGR
jgi:dienelactone hydrolase